MIPLDPAHIAQVAALNPTLAYLLFIVRPRWVPVTYTTNYTFSVGAINQRIAGSLSKPLSTDGWLYDAEYVVRCLNAWAGTPFKEQADYYRELNPYMDYELEFKGRAQTCDARVTMQPTPIQSVIRPASRPNDNPLGIGRYDLLYKDQDIVQFVTLRKTLTVLELPTELIITFKMYQVDACDMRRVPCDGDVLKQLSKALGCDVLGG